MSTRTTHLPALDSHYPLTPGQIEQYRRDGHILLRGVCSREEIEAYRPVLANAVEAFRKKARPLEERDTYGKAFLQVMNIWVDDEDARKFVFSQRMARIAAELMGVRGVRLYHDQALFKEPGGGLTPWHQDHHYWPLDSDNAVTVWIPLVDITADMGVMNFASRSHTAGYLGDMGISDESEEVFQHFVEEQGFPVWRGVDMAAGDATFHSGWTLHNAPPNERNRMREVMTVIYYEDGIKLLKPDNRHRKNDLRVWFPGQKPGELAASRLNPLLYEEGHGVPAAGG